MTQSSDIHAVRLPLDTWNNACLLVAGEATLTAEDWSGLIDAGLAEGPGALDARWAGLIGSYLDTPSSLSISSTYGGLLYRATLALGPANVCVLERFITQTQPDGSVETMSRDDLLEVSVSQAHPWALLRRVLPPLTTVQADPRQTSSANAEPVVVPAAVLEWAQEQCRTHPADHVLETLKQRSSGALHDFFEADDASISYVWTTRSPRGTQLALAWYLASEHHLYRATFGDGAPFEQVAPGDLAFTFEWHLLGVLDALSTPAAQ